MVTASELSATRETSPADGRATAAKGSAISACADALRLSCAVLACVPKPPVRAQARHACAGRVESRFWRMSPLWTQSSERAQRQPGRQGRAEVAAAREFRLRDGLFGEDCLWSLRGGIDDQAF